MERSGGRRVAFRSLICLLAVLSVSLLFAQAPLPDPAVELANRQQQIFRDYERFEKSLFDIAEQMRRKDPERAELLFRARGISQEDRILPELQAISELLKGDAKYGDALNRQSDVVERMRSVLKLLQSLDALDDNAEDIKFFEEQLKALNRILAGEKDTQAETNRGGDSNKLSSQQDNLNRQARELADKLKQHDLKQAKKPGDSSAEGEQPMDGSSPESSPMPGDSKDPSAPQTEPGEKKPGDDNSRPEKMPGDKPEGSEKPMPGDKPSESEKPMPGEPMSGEQKPGESESSPMPGDSQSSKPMPGKPMPGKPMPGQEQSPSQPPNGAPQQPQEQQPGGSPEGQQQQQDQQQQSPGREELEQARREMQQALEELKGKNLKGAAEEQDAAIAKLEEVKANLEKILRQLREEEKEMYLTLLEARFQNMLRKQEQINAETKRLDSIEENERPSTFGAKVEVLKRSQDDNALDAGKALSLLKEEGSSVAFPEAVEQMQRNMETVSRRLARQDTAETTQVIEQLIVETLEEMIFAMQQEMEKLEEQKRQQQQGQPQQPQDPTLVNQLAELKMIRSLQNQVNRLTRQIGMDIEGEQATTSDQLELLQDLAGRQQRIQEATYDLSVGRNQ